MVALIAAVACALCGCAVTAQRDETILPRYEWDGPPRYDRAWGRAGVFVFGDKYVDLRNGLTTVSTVDKLVWDCSTRDFWCLYGGVTFAAPKRCRAFDVGDRWVVRGITMTVRAIVIWPDRSHNPPIPEPRTIYILQSDTTDFLQGPQQQFFAYSRNIEWLTTRGPPEFVSWESVFDAENHDIRRLNWEGPHRSFEPMAWCSADDE